MKKKHSDKSSAKEQQKEAQKNHGNPTGNKRIRTEKYNPETGFSKDFNRRYWFDPDDELFADPGI